MNTGTAIYQSVRLVCRTIILIAIMNYFLSFLRVWALYELQKVEQMSLPRQGEPGAIAPCQSEEKL